MPPEHARSFGGGLTETALSPIVIVAIVLAAILLLLLPRKYAVYPLFFVILLVPLGQQLVIGGVHFFVFRILILFGCFRLLWTRFTSRAPIFAGGLNSIDRAFFFCIVVQAAAVMLLFSNSDAVINQVGFLLDSLGGYFLLRYLLQDEQDVYRAVKCFALLALILGISMVREYYTLNNLFGLIGGKLIPEVREGRVRCQGPFAHPLMAGAFGSTLLCLLVMLWKTGKARTVAVIGFLGAVLMTWTSNSSTSLLSFAAGLLAIGFWPLRKKMRVVRWSLVGALIALHLIMKAPVWFLLAHIDLTGGSSGYHRAALIDTFIRHFSDWWLIGVKDTGVWGWDMWDAQNQFVNVGDTGGLLALILFIVMISRAFARLGDARKAVEGNKKQEWFLWLLGSALFANVVAFFGVNYFDQTKFAWFALLAMVTTATVPLLQKSAVEAVDEPVRLRGLPFAYPLPKPSRTIAKGSERPVPVPLKSRVP